MMNKANKFINDILTENNELNNSLLYSEENE